jgi:hypothetical protein
MASEISFACMLTALKANLSLQLPQVTVTPTMSGSHFDHKVVSIPTTAGGTALSVSADVATLGIARFLNQDATNYVELGIVVSATFYPVFRMKAGEPLQGRLVPGVTYYAKANTAAVNLEFCILED